MAIIHHLCFAASSIGSLLFVFFLFSGPVSQLASLASCVLLPHTGTFPRFLMVQNRWVAAGAVVRVPAFARGPAVASCGGMSEPQFPHL